MLNNQSPELARLYLLAIMLLLFLVAVSTEAQTRNEIEIIIRTVAEQHEFDADLAVAIAEVESGLNPEAIGGLGEIGIFQLRPEFHEVKEGMIRSNAEVAIRYLAYLRKECASYGEAFFVCYNTGPNRRVRYPTLFPYFRKVMRAKQRLAVR